VKCLYQINTLNIQDFNDHNAFELIKWYGQVFDFYIYCLNQLVEKFNDKSLDKTDKQGIVTEILEKSNACLDSLKDNKAKLLTQ